MDLLVEILLEVYMELMILIAPEKNTSKGWRIASKIFAILVIFGVFALVLWGAVLISDYKNLWGIAPIAVAVLISLFQIIAGIILYKRNH